jgi:cell division septation protein DedD
VVFAVDTSYYFAPRNDSLAIPVPKLAGDTATQVPQVVLPDTTSRAPVVTQWSVQVAAVLSEERAREIVRTIRVDGVTPRVVASAVDGARVFRVVMGPFSSRAEADRVGRQSGRDYWVFEGVP